MSETFTDNANLAPDDSTTEERNSDFITRISPGLSLRGQGGRGSVALDYQNNQNFSYRDVQSDHNSNSNNLLGTGQLEFWEKVAFLNASASISQVVEDTDRATSNSIAGENVNRTEARTFRISPSFRHHFGAWAETLTSVAYSATSTESDVVEDTATLSENFSISSGRRFTQVLWSIVGNNSTTRNEDEPTEESWSVAGNGTLVVTSAISLNGSVGWQESENVGLNEDPSGLTWSGGFTARPGPRSSFQLSYGRQDENNSFTLSAAHQLSPRTSIIASYEESVETSQEQLTDNLQFVGQHPVTGQLIDVRTGQPFANDDVFGLEDDTFRQKRFSLGLNGSRERNSFGVNAFWEERDFEVRNTVETAFGGSVYLSRRISPRTSGNISLGYETTDLGTGDDQVENQYDASLGVSYQVGKDIQARLTYHFTFRKVNNASEPDDMRENSVTLGLTKSF